MAGEKSWTGCILGIAMLYLLIIVPGTKTTLPGEGMTMFPSVNSSSYQIQRMGCTDWPNITTISQLKSLLGEEIFANFGINCKFSEAKKILSSLSIRNLNVSVLELPRVNLLLFDELYRDLHYQLYEPTSIIHILAIIRPSNKFVVRAKSADCTECCLPGTIMIHNTRTRIMRKVTLVSNKCVFTPKTTYRLQPVESLNGVHLNLTFANEVSFTNLKKLNGTIAIGGFLNEVLVLLAKHLNFTYSLIETFDGTYGGKDAHTGEWNGMVGMLIRKQADMILAALTVTRARSEVIDFTYPFFEEPLAILVPVREQNETYFYKPLGTEVWLAVFGCLMVVTITAWFCGVLSENTLPGRQITSKYESFITTSTTMFSTVLLKSEDKLVEHRTARILWLSLWVVSLVIVAIYTGNLVAALATQQVKLPFRTLEELAEDKEYSLTVRQGGAIQALFENAKGGVFAKLWRKVKEQNTTVTDSKAAMRSVVNSSDPRAHGGDMNGMTQYMRSLKLCGWRIIPETFFPSGLAIGLPKGSPYNKLISKDLIAMSQYGLFKQWQKTYFLQSACGTRSRYSSASITFSHSWLLLLITLGCLGVCFIILTIELMLVKIGREEAQHSWNS